jgi:hypothetical protein
VAFKARLFHLRGKSAKDSRIAEMRLTEKPAAAEVVAETEEQKAEAAKAHAEKAARMAEHAKKAKAPKPAKPKKEAAKA